MVCSGGMVSHFGLSREGRIEKGIRASQESSF